MRKCGIVNMKRCTHEVRAPPRSRQEKWAWYVEWVVEWMVEWVVEGDIHGRDIDTDTLI